MPAPVCLFPLEPALGLMRLTTDAPVQRLADRLNRHPRTILKWQEAGGVDVWTADLIATSLGMNAEALWPGWECTADHVAEQVPEQLDFLDLAASA